MDTTIQTQPQLENDEPMNEFASGMTASWMRNALERLDPKMYLHEFLQQGTRPDGRCFHQARPTRLVKGILGRSKPSVTTTTSPEESSSSASASSSSQQPTSTIAGSAMIHLGNTVVLSAVTLQVGQPMAGSHPEWGDVVVQMEFASSSSSSSSSSSFLFKTSQWVQGRLIQSQVLDLSQLCLVPGYAAWRLHVTLLIVQDNGNIQDASLLAAVAALMDTRLPATLLQNTMLSSSVGNSHNNNNNNNSASYGANTRAVVTTVLDQPSHPLVVTRENIPVALTMVMYQANGDDDGDAKQKRHLLVDPTTLEETWIRDRLSLVVTSSSSSRNSANDILHMSHHGVMDTELLATACHLAKGRAQELQDLLLLM